MHYLNLQKKYVILLFIASIIFVHNQGNSQGNYKVNSDRPDQSDGTFIIPKSVLQLENGINITKNEIVNNLMIRKSVSKSTELRLLIDAGIRDNKNGIMPLGVSVKQNIYRGNQFIPAITLIGYTRFGKFATENFRHSNFENTVLVAFQSNLTDKFEVEYNLGTTFNNDLIVTTSLVYQAFDKLALFTEYFSTTAFHQRVLHNIDAGAMYHIDDNTQADICIGTGLTKNFNNAFITFGISESVNLQRHHGRKTNTIHLQSP